ncbi:MAG TPA: hypothetical protein VMV09_06595, partial [Candidatus Saccharimonadales bacterium]|nr:hypothetical protein [Candidatus Saccharimonadales bacterium]
MPVVPAPGLTSDWLNGWLAALGVTTLLLDVRLSWTSDPVPAAQFDVPDHLSSLPEALARALPSLEALGELAVARRLPPAADFGRRVSLDIFAERAKVARTAQDWSLSSTVTDLVADLPDEGLPHSPFDPAAPQGRTLWERVVGCRQLLADPARSITATLAGHGERVESNGLGFDVRRLIAGVQEAAKRVDPVVELLAFAGLELMPFRGDGKSARARGWTGPAGRTGAFRWCAWSQALDRWGIDAFLDLVLG